ncbi:hypothetical protein TRFO_07598 [Tritrichomonas foetus]|uniref:Uncharacterized protein n=1 Tax=Tritrichomonas foetus TaxID=1144522 RepID=A0A1J4JQC2_9EUKA|nr:hypothetical protein TRFO_07598 [Tritrichomonas foetus]|eukprot:OHT01359.1 hypothetical protein TRFO_07598 [Tritrichomonas foetus]
MTSAVVPKATEMHRRKWRVKQLDNSIYDIKTTIAACNHQIDDEKEKLEELNSEYDRLQAQARKLAEDAKMLEGVTGIPAAMPKNAENDLMKEIVAFSEHFRASFAEFYLNLPTIKQELPSDPTLARDTNILVSSLRDYMTLQFNNRATDADLSKKIDERTTEVKELDKKITEDENRVEREVAAQRLRIEQSANRMKESIQEQGRQLRKQGHKITSELQAAQDELRSKVGELEQKQRRLKSRVSSLGSQFKSMRENFKRKANEIDLELDRLENRIDSIKQNPCLVDRKLINISLILSKKSLLINKAIGEMRAEIDDFNQWLGH